MIHNLPNTTYKTPRRCIHTETCRSNLIQMYSTNFCICRPGSAVGIATGYGLDGPGSNPGGGDIFPTCPDRPWGPPSPLGYCYILLLPAAIAADNRNGLTNTRCCRYSCLGGLLMMVGGTTRNMLSSFQIK
jgi:hypothetical protein